MHEGCSSASVPLQRMPRVLALENTTLSACFALCAAPPHLRGKCERQCTARELSFRVRELLAAEFPRAVFMPVARATSLRLDAHLQPPEDCSLYQGGGAMDHWARLIHAILQTVLVGTW